MSLNKNNICFFFYFFCCYAISQERVEKDSLITQNLDEVIITATRTLRQLSKVPMPVQLISNKEIKAINSVRLSDLLNEQTGLITVPDFGGGEGIQLQGLDAQYTLVLIDGVPLIGRSAGTLDLNRLAVGNIKQIEIVKGASSSLYGSEAMGGVINIITENPKYNFKGNLNFRYASFNSSDMNVSTSQKNKKLGFTFFFNRNKSDGFDFDTSTPEQNINPFENITLNSRITYDFNDAFQLILSSRYFYQDQINRTQNQSSLALFEGHSITNEWNNTLLLNYEFNRHLKTSFEFYVTRFKTRETLFDSNNILFSENHFNQLFLRPEYRLTYETESAEIVLGTGLTHESLDRSFFMTTPIFNAPYVYAQYDWNPNEKLNLILGARFDAHNQYTSQLNPKLAISYAFNNKITLKSSVGRGFKAPDFRQLYFNFANSSVGYQVIGYNVVNAIVPDLINQNQIQLRQGINLADFNNTLKPESAVNVNLGGTYKPNNSIKASLNLFRNSIQNLIDTRAIATFTNTGQNLFSYLNLNNVFTQGLEFNLQYKPKSELKIAMGYQLLYAKDKAAIQAFESGRVNATSTIILTKDQYFGLFNRSRHMANFKVFYEVPSLDFSTNIRATYRSKFGLFDTNNNGYLDTFDAFVDGYAIIDFAANKKLYKKYELGLGVDNVFDFTDPQNVNNIPGRILYAKLNIQL